MTKQKQVILDIINQKRTLCKLRTQMERIALDDDVSQRVFHKMDAASVSINTTLLQLDKALVAATKAW